MILRDTDQVADLIEKVATDTKKRLTSHAVSDYVIIGIRTGGVWIAEKLHETLECPTPLGILDISFYRDDFSRNGLNPTVKPSNLPFDIEEQDVLLVDDVLMSGRTVRAALNELFDYGRPRSVTLLCLVELKGRELPIQADVIGESITLKPQQRIKLAGPQELHIELQEL